MSKTNDGGPAFPVSVNATERSGCDYGVVEWRGMSVRDYFAGQALAGLCANGGAEFLLAAINEAARKGETTMDLTYSRYAYEFADAMLAARDRPTPKDSQP